MKIKIDKISVALVIFTISLFIVGIKLAIDNPNEPTLIFAGVYLIISAAINTVFTLMYFKNLNS